MRDRVRASLRLEGEVRGRARSSGRGRKGYVLELGVTGRGR